MVPNPNFLTKLQTAEDKVKRRWLIGLTAVAMIIIIFLWVVYFNVLVFHSVEPESQVQAQASDSSGFWSSMYHGTASVANKFFNFFSKFGSEATYTINP